MRKASGKILATTDNEIFNKLISCRNRPAFIGRQWYSKKTPGSQSDSPRTPGIFADEAEPFGDFPRHLGEPGVQETNPNARKAGISGLFSRLLGSLAERRNGLLTIRGSNLHFLECKKAL